jgi:D-glycero-beta-D-manno-heptose 1-phosphate adenylyltransferase
MKHQHLLRSKILDPVRLIEQLDIWRKQNLRIVFTNGCFDLLHAGHVDYLARAADLGDILIVGVNTNDSVRTIKGPTRPIQDEVGRLMVLAGLESVSGLVLFGERTPLKLIELVQPHVLVKGDDYQLHEIVGAKEVLEQGGEVINVPLLQGYSTSAIERKIIDTHLP